MTFYQAEKAQPRDPHTHIIRGAEPFSMGEGRHGILFLHGWTSTPRELRFLAGRLAEKGFHCRGILLPGHGTTLRDLQRTDWSAYLRAASDAFTEMTATCDRVSICGFSMGGLLALHLAARRKVANLILLAPFIYPSGRTLSLIPNKWMVRHIPWWMENLGKSIEGPIRFKSSLPDHIAYHAMPARILAGIVQASRQLREHWGNIGAPTLALHSTLDRTSDFEGSLELMRHLGSEDKSLVALNRSNHIITLDYDRERVESSVTAWMEFRR